MLSDDKRIRLANDLLFCPTVRPAHRAVAMRLFVLFINCSTRTRFVVANAEWRADRHINLLFHKVKRMCIEWILCLCCVGTRRRRRGEGGERVLCTILLLHIVMNGTAKSKNDFILKIEEAKPQSYSMCTAAQTTHSQSNQMMKNSKDERARATYASCRRHLMIARQTSLAFEKPHVSV